MEAAERAARCAASEASRGGSHVRCMKRRAHAVNGGIARVGAPSVRRGALSAGNNTRLGIRVLLHRFKALSGRLPGGSVPCSRQLLRVVHVCTLGCIQRLLQ